jgi:leucyl aminopeptidase
VVHELSDDLGSDVVERAFLGWHLARKFPHWKSEEVQVPELRVGGGGQVGAARGSFLARVLNDARYLIDAPSESMGPLEMEGVMKDLAERYGASFRVVEGEELEEGFPLVAAVGRASSRKPRVVDMEWRGGDLLDVCLVGKGVCFDTGGLNLKPTGGMRLMRKDMGGAAIVLGLAEALMGRGVEMGLRVVVPLAENGVSGNAFRPGDVFRSRGGLRVEVGNTDAEGRLLLADCLSFVGDSGRSYDMVLDVATLTGAARVALGTDVGGLFCRDEEWSHRFLTSCEEEDDPLWRLPLYDGYKEELVSKIADVVSCAESGYGGAITAALFLEKFVGGRFVWGHIDTMAWNRRGRPGRPEGGEAQCVRGLLRSLENYVEERRSEEGR